MLRAISSKSARSVVTEATEFPESRRIHDEVSAAAKRYEQSRAKLQGLIASLKKQHSLVLKTSEKRLQTAKQFEAFLADTPLSKLVSEVGSAEAKEKVFARSPPASPKATHIISEVPESHPLEKIESEDAGSDRSSEDEAPSRSSVSTAAEREGDTENTGSDVEIGASDDRGEDAVVGSNTDHSAVSENGAVEEESTKELDEGLEPKPVETDEEMALRLAKQWEDEAEEWKGPSNENEDGDMIKACATDVTESTEQSHDSLIGPKSPEENKPHAQPAVPQNKRREEDARSPQEPFEPLVFDGSDFDEVHHSFGAVHEAAHKLTLLYSDQYSSSIIKYVEDWDKAASTRIHGRLLEFDRLKLNLEHYVQKVDGLRTNIKKRESRKRQVSPKASQRFDRNELKLGGAREAYDSYGDSLLLLLEEVTDRGWRDCYPLLMRAMQYDINFSADQAKVFATLNETVEMLEELGTGREVDPDGRIRALRELKPEEIYTGGKHVVPPVHSTRDVYEV